MSIIITHKPNYIQKTSKDQKILWELNVLKAFPF